MRKRKVGRKFHRKTGQRKAFLKSLATALILKEKIKTTQARAKEISSVVEKMITRAKNNNLSSKKALLQILSPEVAKKLIDEIAPRFKERNGGYTRIFKVGQRRSDASKMAIIEILK